MFEPYSMGQYPYPWQGITPQEFDAVKQQASEIAKVLGIK